MKATINEISGNVAEVELEWWVWNAAVNCNVALEDGYFDVILDAWIALADDYNVPVAVDYLTVDARPVINDALREYYAAHNEQSKINEDIGNA